MEKLVVCSHCGKNYDLMKIKKIIARYDDCTVFESPCCKQVVDDRAWKSLPDFIEVSKDNICRLNFE